MSITSSKISEPKAMAKVGDWVSFYGCGYLHYDEVTKVAWDSFYNEFFYTTGWGTIRESKIEEVRSAKKAK